VSFEKLFQVPQEAFSQILEWSSTETRCHVIGIIKFSRLVQSNWWKKAGTSLILLPEPFDNSYADKKEKLFGAYEAVIS
jgi:hypothetical protein